jgi:hypothetical protein
MKVIVTHVSVDLDAITACWLIKRFLPNWKNACIKFVHAGSTLDKMPPDDNKNIIHVDTGMGKFDHHQHDQYTCAAKLVFNHLNESKKINHLLILPLERIINFVNDIDHFAEVYYHDATSDTYEFLLSNIIDGLKSTLRDDNKIVDVTMLILDAMLQIFKNKVKAEVEIKKAYVFQSKLGKSIALETNNEEAMKFALKSGYSLVIRRNLHGSIRIKTLPSRRLDLTPLYYKIQKIDKKATWFLHASKNMLLNGSSKNPSLVPSMLSLQKIIEIIKKI